MDHCVFRFATRGQCIKGKKLDRFEHNHIFCFKFQCCTFMHCHLVEIERRSGPLICVFCRLKVGGESYLQNYCIIDSNLYPLYHINFI